MPMLIEYLDSLALRLGRSVLFLGQMPGTHDESDFDHWIRSSSAKQIVRWLDAEGIGHGVCGTTSNSGWIEGGPKYLYVDIPFEIEDPQYRRLSDFLQDDPEGKTRWPDTGFYVYPLEDARKIEQERREEMLRYVPSRERPSAAATCMWLDTPIGVLHHELKSDRVGDRRMFWALAQEMWPELAPFEYRDVMSGLIVPNWKSDGQGWVVYYDLYGSKFSDYPEEKKRMIREWFHLPAGTIFELGGDW
ncbi:hypothetical protein OPU71_16910 [Niveibacterium sp. 24ML]|uniref:hypothetical protein n=1 Tax=Niveibacterium sp. 24ML TaxID=2985512 RepID=UPI00226F0836|nr:hypothetical protein [Niveibacterium sp. 24ML]MCX9157806.1 hypothetical protein [Niveibacterium sp. 24ML]